MPKDENGNPIPDSQETLDENGEPITPPEGGEGGEEGKQEEIDKNLAVALKQEREKNKVLAQKLADKGNTSNNPPIIDEEAIGKVVELREMRQRHNGNDGLPKWSDEELKEFAEKEGFDWNKVDREKVYKLKYGNEILDHEKKIAIQKSRGVYTPTSGSGANGATTGVKNAQSLGEINKILQNNK